MQTIGALILAHYEISYRYWGIGFLEALIVAKVILFAEHVLHLGRGLEKKPLIIPTLYKTFIFTIFLSFFRILEALVYGLLSEKGQSGVLSEIKNMFGYDWLAGNLVVFFSLVPFFAVKELSRVMGRERVRRLFFQPRTEAVQEFSI